MVQIVRHDLEFILKQIRIAEAHSAGGNLADLVGGPLLPYGLRTVDGSYNNLIPGREQWGAADQPFKELLDPTYQNENDGDSIQLGPNSSVTNNDYGQAGDVADADPRIISNLISDQTAANPAAVAAMGDGFTIDHDNDQNTPDLVFIPNVSPDEGLSSPFNGWMTLFGQFFDHGLDLVTKGGNGTIYIPLQPDDPLYVEGSHTNFMALTRTSPDPVNKTTPWVDQNQTYGSHASKQVFMREYIKGPDGTPIATGHLLEGSKGGLATWADIKEQARELLGIELTDLDVGNIPLIAADPYGNFIPGPNGYAQLVIGLGADGKFGTDDDVLVEGNPASPVNPSTVVNPENGAVGAIRTGHAFLDDIAHNAVPVVSNGQLAPDADSVVSGTVPNDGRGHNTAYDNELLDAHYITGDGRGNENIGLTAVHHVFHSEHNRIVEETKELALGSGDLAFLNEWLLVDVAEIPTTAEGIAALVWDGERLFQSGRFVTEMEYQHLVFEEFARKIQPDIDAFVFEPSVDIDPAITAEFAHVVYRFGHSMLTEDIARIRMVDGKPVADDIKLFDAFLNPVEFDSMGTADQAAGAIIRGMTRQVGSEIDEFVTDALRNQLLGLPLDLPALNITRARDAGVPSLNAAREKFFEATHDTQLKPYASWVDFAMNLKHPMSIVNFVAAYGTHETITAETTIIGKRAAAMALVLGQTQTIADDPTTTANESRVFTVPADRVAFLNSTGPKWGTDETGLNLVDFWIGGLAEKKMAFGGMLGSTFSFVFEMTLENLQDGDRFYYLSRAQGLNLLNELESNSFAKLVMLNTDLGDAGSTHLPADLFATMSNMIEMDKSKQIGPDPTRGDPVLDAIRPLVVREDRDGDGDADYIEYNGLDHVMIGGTEEDDIIISGGGDDALWGLGGDDYIEAGYGVDKVHGGDGDDIIVNAGTDIGETDFLHGDAGDDVIHGGSGLALVFGNEGNDFLVAGPDGKEVFGGTGDDFILGGDGGDFLLGNEGDDWIEGGGRFDTLAGENSELFFNSTIIGHDVLNGGSNDTDYDAESGDDIMFQSEGIQRNNGMAGFDWAIHKGDPVAANSDLGIPIFVNQEAFILRDRFDLVEGLSGWIHNDVLTGRAIVTGAIGAGGAIPNPDGSTPLASYSNALLESGVARIAGLRDLLSHLSWDESNPDAIVLETDDASDILLGGGGSDTIEGKAGNDVIDGDAWLNVRISVRDKNDPAREIASADSMAELQAKVFSREYSPSQLVIVREILNGNRDGDIDTAVFSDLRTNYDVIKNPDGTVTVVHARGTQTDGTDTLRNIERMKFSDVTEVLNRPATGAPTINDTTPTEGQALTASPAGIVDPDGFAGATFSYQWQVFDGVTWQDIAGATSASFTPSQDQVDHLLRVSVSYTDDAGSLEQRFSAATSVVGDLFTGSDAADTVQLKDGDDIAFGGGDRDTLSGGAGNDTLYGGIAGDRLDGGTGADMMIGGLHNDIYVVDNVLDVVVEFAELGIDMVEISLSSYTLGANVENLIYTGNGNFTGVGNSLDNKIWGSTGADILEGAAGADSLIGGAGNDILNGGSGDDTLNGGAGSDVFVFGSDFGHDQIRGFDSNPTGGQDLLDISGLGVVAGSFGSVSIAQVGANTLITFAGHAGNSITLLDVAAASISQTDFIFAA